MEIEGKPGEDPVAVYQRHLKTCRACQLAYVAMHLINGKDEIQLLDFIERFYKLTADEQRECLMAMCGGFTAFRAWAKDGPSK